MKLIKYMYKYIQIKQTFSQLKHVHSILANIPNFQKIRKFFYIHVRYIFYFCYDVVVELCTNISDGFLSICTFVKFRQIDSFGIIDMQRNTLQNIVITSMNKTRYTILHILQVYMNYDEDYDPSISSFKHESPPQPKKHKTLPFPGIFGYQEHPETSEKRGKVATDA